MSEPVAIAIDARQISGASGGVETVIRGLAQGLTELDATDLDVTFVTYSGNSDWLASDVGKRQNIVEVDAPARRQRAELRARGFGRRWAWRAGVGIPSTLSAPPDRQINELNPDVVHYPFQRLALPHAPFIYHPHDLQHVTLPEFFNQQEMADREIGYRLMCERAALVAVGTQWVKNDVAAHLQVPVNHISVISLAPPTHSQGEGSGPAPVLPPLPQRFLLYPAINWPHKNHIRLIEAVAKLADQGLDVHLVLTGTVYPNHADPSVVAAAYGVADQVHVLGFVSAQALDALYERAAGVVVPTLFEAASFPVWEAFQKGVPVACSNVTSLPEQVGDAALLFDPTDGRSLEDAMRTLWQDEATAKRLGEAGRKRVATFTWQRTAERFAAHYRHIAGRHLSDRDKELLHDDSLDPSRGEAA